MKKELLELGAKIGFLTHNKLIEISNKEYYIWMCKLQKYFRDTFEIDITIDRSFSMAHSYNYFISKFEWEYEECFQQLVEPNRSYEQTLEDALLKVFTII